MSKDKSLPIAISLILASFSIINFHMITVFYWSFLYNSFQVSFSYHVVELQYSEKSANLLLCEIPYSDLHATLQKKEESDPKK